MIPPAARLLDITRTIRRAGRVPTGVDRVERAYLRHLPTLPEPLFALARTTLGYILLDTGGIGAIAARVDGRQPWGPADRLALMARRQPLTVRQAESDLRRFALDRCLPARLDRMLARHLPAGTAYLNVGHSNLTDRVLAAVRDGAGGRIAVLLHDTIPMDFPHYQRPGSAAKFAAMLARVRAGADLVICNSAHTARRARAHMGNWGPVPETIVARLGVDVPVPGTLPDGFDPARPWFMALGTIEPRKGHDLLLDLWDELQADTRPDTPRLLICGARGWNNAAVFRRLDKLPPDGLVQEMPGLNDGQVAALLQGSCGLLFPSRAEGYGLPPIEAAALGVPVVCTDLPSLREVLGDIPVYAAETDRYLWRNMIGNLAGGRGRDQPGQAHRQFIPPDWAQHFKTVLSFT
jgi:glycosyltransferase involved in cell wall biosynthesis